MSDKEQCVCIAKRSRWFSNVALSMGNPVVLPRCLIILQRVLLPMSVSGLMIFMGLSIAGVIVE